MSRSHRNRSGKGPGFDYWGRRALSGVCGHGKSVKLITHQIERARAKRSLRDEQDHPKRESF